MKEKFIYLYYLVLILVLILYTKSASPGNIVRLGYLAALVAPLLTRIVMYPAVILCALCISKHTFAYPLMPTEMYYYVILSLLFTVLSIPKKRNSFKPLFIIVLAYLAINDMFFQGDFSSLTTLLFLMILLYICSEKNIETSSQLLSFTFIILSLAISYWSLFCPESSINSYNKIDDMEQIGWRDPNYLSCALGTGLVVSVSELFKVGKSKYYLILLITTIVLSVISLLGLASRGITLAVSISIGSMILFSKVKNRIKVLTIVSLFIFLLILYTNQFFEFLIARINNDDGTGSSRTIIWAKKINAFWHEANVSNWLFGFGKDGGFKLGYYGGVSTHNDYISILINYGVVGVFLFLKAITYPLRVCSLRMRPQIVAFLLYLLVCSMSIEPICLGNIAYLGFILYIVLIARNSSLVNSKPNDRNIA